VVVRQVCGEPPPPPPLPGGARLLVHADSNEIAGTSTFTDGAFALTNTSDQEITRVTLDLRSMALPDVVFDPTGTAGNDLGKGFDIKQSGGTGVTTPYLAEGSPPFGAPLGNGGYQTLTIDVADFDAGETLTVSVDTDPISVEGAAPGGAGFVNGVALPGATVTVTYADGTTHVGQVMGDGSLAGGEVFLRASLALALTLDVGGIGGGETGELLGIRQALSISGGPAGATVRVQLIHGDLIPDVPPGPVRDPLTQANAAVDVD
jgi:hypothetical protein